MARGDAGFDTVLPLLVRRLIAETASGLESLDMPGGSGTAVGGFDGIVTASKPSAFVPKGTSVWGPVGRTKRQSDGIRDWSRPIWGVDDEGSVWVGAIDLILLNTGNAYDALACLFGVRNSYGFRPLAEGRGLPVDASGEVRATFAGYGGPARVHSTTWITRDELAGADWDETDRSGARSRRAVAGDTSYWGPCGR
nr:hypothetical protein OG999_31080 [Streptomyces sp. NBC_00886]